MQLCWRWCRNPRRTRSGREKTKQNKNKSIHVRAGFPSCERRKKGPVDRARRTAAGAGVGTEILRPGAQICTAAGKKNSTVAAFAKARRGPAPSWCMCPVVRPPFKSHRAVRCGAVTTPKLQRSRSDENCPLVRGRNICKSEREFSWQRLVNRGMRAWGVQGQCQKKCCSFYE